MYRTFDDYLESVEKPVQEQPTELYGGIIKEFNWKSLEKRRGWNITIFAPFYGHRNGYLREYDKKIETFAQKVREKFSGENTDIYTDCAFKWKDDDLEYKQLKHSLELKRNVINARPQKICNIFIISGSVMLPPVIRLNTDCFFYFEPNIENISEGIGYAQNHIHHFRKEIVTLYNFQACWPYVVEILGNPEHIPTIFNDCVYYIPIN